MPSTHTHNRTIQTILDLIKKESNLNFSHFQRNILENKIQKRISRLKLTSYKQYLIHLVNNKDEINNFIKEFNIHQPYFFQDIMTFKELEKIIISYFIYNKSSINIWLYPSYSGEEAYTIAIFFELFIKKHNLNLDFKIVASYYDKFALEKALLGIYTEGELLHVPKEIVRNYFKKEHKKKTSVSLFLINDSIKKRVEFLSEAIIFGHSKMDNYDLIFCRYLMSYLTSESQEKLLKIFDNHTNQGSFLIFGLMDKIQYSFYNLEPLNLNRQIYRKNYFSEKEIKPKLINIQNDRVFKQYKKDELYIPAAHYGIINSDQGPSSMAIYGLGSCIALILRDLKKNIHGMSHILLPDSSMTRNNDHLINPHKYIDTSIIELKKELINHGAEEKNISAIVVGGANTINYEHMINNADSITKKLNSFKIKIEKQDLGGRKWRSIVYNAKNGSVLVKKDGEKSFKKL